jgi:GTP cyclohydrolase N terminal
LYSTGQSVVAKAAIEPVWYLPEVARRFQTTESNLRQSIFRMTNGMYPELITRPDIKVCSMDAGASLGFIPDMSDI